MSVSASNSLQVEAAAAALYGVHVSYTLRPDRTWEAESDEDWRDDFRIAARAALAEAAPWMHPDEPPLKYAVRAAALALYDRDNREGIPWETTPRRHRRSYLEEARAAVDAAWQVIRHPSAGQYPQTDVPLGPRHHMPDLAVTRDEIDRWTSGLRGLSQSGPTLGVTPFQPPKDPRT